jgi:hypothetical protein
MRGSTPGLLRFATLTCIQSIIDAQQTRLILWLVTCGGTK